MDVPVGAQLFAEITSDPHTQIVVYKLRGLYKGQAISYIETCHHSVIPDWI